MRWKANLFLKASTIQNQLKASVESVTKRMRWKANIFLKGSATRNQSNLFGLSSKKSPPSIPLLKSFEDDLIKLIEDVKFRRSKDQFQTSLPTI
jgi:hypothetical protein